MRHAEQPGFNKAKFAPTAIHNEMNLDGVEPKAHFLSGHTLGDCAGKCECAEAAIKRHLQTTGVDTSLPSRSTLAAERSATRRRTYTYSDDQVKQLFIDQNLDTKTIAEMHEPPVHYNVVRRHIKRLGLKKDRKAIARSMSARHIRQHGYRHPAQRPDVLAKASRFTARVRYIDKLGRTFIFRSFDEAAFALLLEQRGLEWYYEDMQVPYVDAITGKQRLYYIDFTIVHPDGAVEWVEIKSRGGIVPNDKYVFTARRAEESGVIFRTNTAAERVLAREICNSGYRAECIEFLRARPRCDAARIAYWFKTVTAARKFRMPGWQRKAIKSYSPTWHALILRRQ